MNDTREYLKSNEQKGYFRFKKKEKATKVHILKHPKKFTYQLITTKIDIPITSQQKFTFQSHHNKSSHSNAFQQCSHSYVLQKFTFQLITTEVHIPTHCHKNSHSSVLQKLTFQHDTSKFNNINIPTHHNKSSHSNAFQQ